MSFGGRVPFASRERPGTVGPARNSLAWGPEKVYTGCGAKKTRNGGPMNV